MGAERATVRATLAAYSSEYLRYVYTMASAVTLLAYCLWAFEQADLEGAVPVVRAVDRARSRSASCATRCCWSRATAGRPRRSCSATARSSCWGWRGWCCSPSASRWSNSPRQRSRRPPPADRLGPDRAHASQRRAGRAAPERCWRRCATPASAARSPAGSGRAYGDAAQNAGGHGARHDRDSTRVRASTGERGAVDARRRACRLDALIALAAAARAGSRRSRRARATSPSAARSPPTSTARTTIATALRRPRRGARAGAPERRAHAVAAPTRAGRCSGPPPAGWA